MSGALHEKSLAAIVRDIKSGALLSRTVTEHMLARIDEREPVSRAFVMVLAESALRDADAADASKGGAWLEILNEEGYRLRGFTKEDCTPMKTDDLAHPAAWKDKTLSALPPGKYILRVHLEKADLFAVTLKN